MEALEKIDNNNTDSERMFMPAVIDRKIKSGSQESNSNHLFLASWFPDSNLR
jgi:hypothetical protein